MPNPLQNQWFDQKPLVLYPWSNHYMVRYIGPNRQIHMGVAHCAHTNNGGVWGNTQFTFSTLCEAGREREREWRQAREWVELTIAGSKQTLLKERYSAHCKAPYRFYNTDLCDFRSVKCELVCRCRCGREGGVGCHLRGWHGGRGGGFVVFVVGCKKKRLRRKLKWIQFFFILRFNLNKLFI